MQDLLQALVPGRVTRGFYRVAVLAQELGALPGGQVPEDYLRVPWVILNRLS
jgi:hypothetical protein